MKYQGIEHPVVRCHKRLGINIAVVSLLRNLLRPKLDVDSDEEANILREQLSQDAATLSPYDLRWRDRKPFLEGKGYMLRPLYHVE